MMNQFFVTGTKTEHRKKAKDDYIICINSNKKKQLCMGKFAVITHQIQNENRNKLLKTHCRVIIDESLPDSQIRADQTIRNAIGIPYGYDEETTTVEVYPLNLSLFQSINEYISYLLGRRYLFLRVNISDIPDLEKNLSRIPLEAFKLLGTNESNRIVLESPIKNNKNKYILKKFDIKAFELSHQIIEMKTNLQKEYPDRYLNADEILKIKPDIWPIHIDRHIRDMLILDSLDAVKVRRDLFDLFLNEVREFGIIFFLSLFTIVQILPIKIDWWLLILIILISLLIAVNIILMNIRARLK